MMNSKVECKLSSIVFSLFLLFIGRGVFAGTEAKEGTVIESKDVVVVGEKSNPVEEKKSKPKSKTKKFKPKKFNKVKVVPSAKTKSRSAKKNIRSLGQFNRTGDIKSFQNATDKLTAFIESGDFSKLTKKEEMDLFKSILKVGTITGSSKFDSPEHVAAALKLLNVATKAKFNTKGIVKRLEKLQKRIEQGEKDPNLFKLKQKKAAQARSAKKGKGRIKIVGGSKGMKKRLTSVKKDKKPKKKSKSVKKELKSKKADKSKKAATKLKKSETVD